MIHVLSINGSMAHQSHTGALLRHIDKTLSTDTAFSSHIWDLRSRPLPIALPEYHKDPLKNPDTTVQDFVQRVAQADVLILGTPLYHASYSGVLKNALDNLSGDALRGKWVGLVGNVGGIRADMVAFSHLRAVVNALVGYTLQTQIKTCTADYTRDDANDLTMTSDEVHTRVERLIAEIKSVRSPSSP